jgi:putative FmdB family regulatory protein
MPTYDYICENCGLEFEEFQSITAKPLRKCPECGKRRLKRLIGSGSAVLFKGAGFYETDYRSENYKSGEKNAKEKTEKKKDTAKSKDKKPKKKEKPGKDRKKTA